MLVFYIEKLFFLEPKIQRSTCAFTHRQAGLFLAELNDIKNFSTHKKLIKYAGTDPVVKQSGLSAVAQAGKYKLKMSISKQGSPFLRNILFQMAVGVVKWNPCFREYFLRKKQQFGSYKKAMIALVNKLIRVIYAICTNFRAELVKPMCSVEVIHA